MEALETGAPVTAVLEMEALEMEALGTAVRATVVQDTPEVGHPRCFHLV
jgi:hypothetical protein